MNPLFDHAKWIFNQGITRPFQIDLNRTRKSSLSTYTPPNGWKEILMHRNYCHSKCIARSVWQRIRIHNPHANMVIHNIPDATIFFFFSIIFQPRPRLMKMQTSPHFVHIIMSTFDVTAHNPGPYISDAWTYVQL